MINLSLDLYKMENRTYKLQPTLVDVTEIINRIREEQSQLIKTKSVEIEFKAPVGKSEIAGEQLLCYSMLANLIKNAIEAAPEATEVRVTFYKNDDYKIEIHNYGVVPKAIRNCFFDKLSTSGKKRGTGLGTYSAKLIAQTLHGDIKMESSEEKGTTVTVTIPTSLLEQEKNVSISVSHLLKTFCDLNGAVEL